MRHLSDGVLRRLIDEPLAISDSDQRHLRSCSACRERRTTIGAVAASTAQLFAGGHPSVNTARALAAVNRRITQDPVRRTVRRGLPRLRRGAGRMAGAFALVLAVVASLALSPAGSLAQSFITIFQPSQVATVAVTSSDLRQLSGLARYGSVHVPQRVPSHAVHDASAASKATGMTVLVPATLPTGVSPVGRYTVSPGATASFTFNAARARRTTRTTGKAMPRRIDGSTLQLTVGNSVIATYGDTTAIPDLVVGQMIAPRITSTGVTVKELEDYVLSLPDVPPTVAQQIRKLGDPATTLPLPVPVDMAHSEKVIVQGVEGVTIGDQTGAGSVVVWEKDGIIYGVGGPLKQSEVLAVANSLHP